MIEADICRGRWCGDEQHDTLPLTSEKSNATPRSAGRFLSPAT
jgi:hypothetical protein